MDTSVVQLDSDLSTFSRPRLTQISRRPKVIHRAIRQKKSDIAYVRGKMGLGNTKKIVDRLVLLGVIKKIDGLGRTIRPVYINFRNLE